MNTPDYAALRAQTPRRRRNNRRFTPEVAAARQKEQQRRNATAQGRAESALAKLHPDDYRSLYQQALAEVRAERGALPGDEDAA